MPTRLKNYNYGITGTYFLTICTKDRRNILSNIATNLVGDGDHDAPKIKNSQAFCLTIFYV